ncbi:MAG: thiamine-phosphate kinase [Dehalococcoidia bacterium]
MDVAELGEFGLIERLGRAVGAERPESVIVGIGDDAAAWRAGGAVLLATTDTLVEGVHFVRDWTPLADLGWKAIAVNVSDIAAMGGAPELALVTLSLPPRTEVEDVDALYEGIHECCQEYDVAVVGGDIVRAPQLSVTVAMLGRAEQEEAGQPLLMRRDAAQAGYSIAVTGTLGDSAAGLVRLKKGAPADDPLVRAHLRPRPPLEEAQQAARLGVPCAIDISDGLLQDIGHVCQRSGLGAVVRADSIPLSRTLREAFPDHALSLACSGGEDYQLALVAPQETMRLVRASPGVQVAVIGEMVESEEHRARLLDASGDEILIDAAGWDHLRG